MRFLLFFFISLIFFNLSCSLVKPEVSKPIAQKGAIDLSKWDFNKNGIVSLSGVWEFYWNRLYTPDFIKKDNSIENPEFVKVPHYFKSQLSQKKKVTFTGYATFRLKIILQENLKSIAFHFPSQGTACRYYINNSLVFSVGKVGTTKETTEPNIKRSIYTVPNPDAELVLTVHIANFYHYIGGFNHSIKIGTKKDITNRREYNILLEFLLFGSIMVICFYHFSIFMFRKKEKTSLTFSILCFLIGIRILVQDEIYLNQIIADIPWHILTRIEYLTFYLGIPIFAYYIHTLFKKETSKIVTYVLLVIGAIFFLLVVFTPPIIFTRTLHIYQVLTLLFCIYCTVSLALATVRRSPGSEIFLIGAIIFGITVTNDILHSRKIIETAYVVSWGLFIFILSQAFLLSKRLGETITTIENLKNDLSDANEELSALNLTLEQKVEERTEELKNAIGRIQIINKDLLDSNEKLEEAHKIINDDMILARKVQEASLITDFPKCKNWDIAFFYRPMSEVSGDFYDLYIEDDILHGVSLFDISGHGVASGLISLLAKSIIHRNFYSFMKKPLNHAMEQINEELIFDIGKVEKHLTGLLLRFTENTIEYVNAAHTDLLHKDTVSNTINIIGKGDKKIRGRFLGIEVLKSNYNSLEYEINNGDFLVLYSDGLTESFNQNSEQFQLERVVKLLQVASNNVSAKELLNVIVASLFDFVKEKPLKDDVTIIILKRIQTL